MKTEQLTELPASRLTRKQVKQYGPKPIAGYGNGALITAEVRFDDECGNGHNTFAITAEVRIPGRRDIEAGGCMHDEIAKAFPDLAPFIKWHLTSTDGPMHYPGNVTFLAGERDCHGLLKGEFRQFESHGPRQNGGIEGVPNWVLELPDRQSRDVYAYTKPAPVTLEWQPYGRTGEGKARELDSARHCAVWPEATDAELCQDKATLEAVLMARLPSLMAEFKVAVESLGFIY